MDQIRWRAVTYSVGSGKKVEKFGSRDLVEIRRAKAREEAAERVRERQAIAARLRARGLRLLGGKLEEHFSQNIHQLVAEEAEKEVDEQPLHEGEEKEAAQDEQERRQRDFFQKGLERRVRATTDVRKVTGSRRIIESQTRKLRHTSIVALESTRREPQRMREDRIGMKKADLESRQVEKNAREAAVRQDNFHKAREVMHARMLAGFVPNQNYGRTQYFAKLGINKKAGKLGVSTTK